MASSREVFERAHELRAAFSLVERCACVGGNNALEINCWGAGRKKYMITLVLNGEMRLFFAPTTRQACETLRILHYTLSIVKQV